MGMPVQTDRMLPIPPHVIQDLLRRSQLGALGTDPVVPEPKPRAPRPPVPRRRPTAIRVPALARRWS
jgi:hypothetical protein